MDVDATAISGPDPRYPVGKFRRPEPGPLPEGELAHAISTIAELPMLLRNAVQGLDPEQLGTPYRTGGWTVRQVVSHLADSHMTAFFRVRMALTADWPAIVPYDQGAFAELHDSVAAPLEWSLELVESLHARWVMMLQSLDETQWQRGFKHPEQGSVTVELATLTYAWHSRHHLAQITHLRAAQGW